MTEAQMKLVIDAAQMGMACGLNFPQEWYVNASRFAPQTMTYDKVSSYDYALIEAFVEFFKGSSSMPGDPVEDLTIETFGKFITEWYEMARRQCPNCWRLRETVNANDPAGME